MVTPTNTLNSLFKDLNRLPAAVAAIAVTAATRVTAAGAVAVAAIAVTRLALSLNVADVFSCKHFFLQFTHELNCVVLAVEVPYVVSHSIIQNLTRNRVLHEQAELIKSAPRSMWCQRSPLHHPGLSGEVRVRPFVLVPALGFITIRTNILSTWVVLHGARVA